MLREVADDNLLCDDDMGVGTSVIDTGDQPASTSTSDVSVNLRFSKVQFSF